MIRRFNGVTNLLADLSPSEIAELREKYERRLQDKLPNVTSSPVESSLAKGSPVKSTPVESSPVKSLSAKSSPVKSSPAKISPIESSPVKSSPVKSSPVKRRIVPPKRKIKSEVEKLLIWVTGQPPQQTEILKNMVAACEKIEPKVKEEVPGWDDGADARPARAAAIAAVKKGQGQSSSSSVVQSKPKNAKKSTPAFRIRPAISRKDKIPKGRGRKTIKKKERLPKPIRGQPNDGALQFRKSIICEGVYYQIGDIVSVHDTDGGGPYFLQIQHLVTDEYFRECAELKWLVPRSPQVFSQVFEPKNYRLCSNVPSVRWWLTDVDFVAHCPPDYYNEDKDPRVVYGEAVEGAVYIRVHQSKDIVNFAVPDIPEIRRHNETVKSESNSEETSH